MTTVFFVFACSGLLENWATIISCCRFGCETLRFVKQGYLPATIDLFLHRLASKSCYNKVVKYWVWYIEKCYSAM